MSQRFLSYVAGIGSIAAGLATIWMTKNNVFLFEDEYYPEPYDGPYQTMFESINIDNLNNNYDIDDYCDEID